MVYCLGVFLSRVYDFIEKEYWNRLDTAAIAIVFGMLWAMAGYSYRV